jgi:DNA-directed RNA polymerase II subunit RPB7
MFFLKTLTHRIVLPPQYFGPGLNEEVQNRLRKEVEGTCHGRFGFIICVLSIKDIGQGKIQDSYGHATFDVKYEAILLKPFNGQVVDAIVGTMNKMGIFADVGPLHVFVSTHSMPSDLKFDTSPSAATNPCFVSEDQTIKISKGDTIRLRIIGVRIDAKELFTIGTIKEDYLGWIERN